MASSNYTAFLKPYQENAQTSGDKLNQFVSNNLNNAQGYNDIMAGYQMDPATQYRINRTLGQNNNQFAASGMKGSGFNQFANADAANQLIADNQQQYFNNRMGLQNQALGTGQHFYDQGLNATQMGMNDDYNQELLGFEKQKYDESKDSWLGGALKFGANILGNAVGVPFGAGAKGLAGYGINSLGRRFSGNENYDYRDYINDDNYYGSKNSSKTGAV